MKDFDPFAPVGDDSSWAFQTSKNEGSGSSFYSNNYGSNSGSTSNFYSSSPENSASKSNFYSQSQNSSENSFGGWGDSSGSSKTGGSAWTSGHEAESYRGWVNGRLDENRKNFHHWSDMNDHMEMLGERSWMDSVEQDNAHGNSAYKPSFGGNEEKSSSSFYGFSNEKSESDKKSNFYSWVDSNEDTNSSWNSRGNIFGDDKDTLKRW